jgi:hypothetical protein
MRESIVSKLKDVSLATGAGTPPPASKYGATPRPDKMASPTVVPRDAGMLADGTTGGNFSPRVMNAIPTSIGGPRGTGADIDGADQSKAAQEANSK